MLILTILLTLLIAVFFAWLPGRLDHRKINRADLWSGPGLVLAVWIWAGCIYSKPGLTAGFDAFRLLGIAGMALWTCAVVCGFRLRHRLPRFRTAAAVGLLLASALGLELFVCNLNFWATHSYTPVDLRPYLTEAADAEAPLTLNDEHNTLTFAGLDQELYNLQLIGLTYQYDGPHPEVQSPMFTLTVAATDEASSVSRQSWPWQVAARSVRSQTRSLDLSGKASTLTLTAAAYAVCGTLCPAGGGLRPAPGQCALAGGLSRTHPPLPPGGTAGDGGSGGVGVPGTFCRPVQRRGGDFLL